MYVIVVMAVLAMMIPMSLPVSAAGETLTMEVYDVGTGTWVTDGNGTAAFNISGTTVRVTSNMAVDNWTIENVVVGYDNGFNYGPAIFVGTPGSTVAYVIGEYGEANITAHYADGDSVTVNKKWGLMDHTAISAHPASQYVTWNETSKSWSGSGYVTDVMYGDFIENGAVVVLPAQGAILNWYLVSGDEEVSLAPGYAPALKTEMAGLVDAEYVEFVTSTYNKWDKTDPSWLGVGPIQTTTNAAGSSTVYFGAWFEEVVQVVVVPEYPNNPNRMVTPEVIALNFGTRELEVVPQVRWAGEKIVLEANFGLGLEGSDVEFYLQNQSVGTLEGIDDDSEAASVWTTVDENGIASAILTSLVSGQADVVAALYPEGPEGAMTNQHAFRVYFLNFESLVLTDVDGKRADHNDGPWTPENPYNDNFPTATATTDMEYQLLNVSQDALERVQVRGWFVPPQGTQMSTRPAAAIDIDADGEVDDLDDVLAPAGRWILPDDWARLAGYSNWQERRIHWDIMDSPSDTVLSDNLAAMGPYNDMGTLVAPANVIGPFAPGLEFMTPSGWMIDNVFAATEMNLRFGTNTVVPNGELDAWDAPMPPAKIILEVMSGVGFFKDAFKTDIYYTAVGGEVLYTAPFYYAFIPAHQAIPAFNNQAGGGYDWDSFDGVHGPYAFWKIINQPEENALTFSDETHPTKIEVYSDNHGEAMAFLNGDWNLDLSLYTGKGGADVPLNEIVGDSIIQAMADYPYIRADQSIVSNTVEKEWFWSGQILGTDSHDFGTNPETGLPIAEPTDSAYTKMVLTAGNYIITPIPGVVYPDELGTSNDKVVWIWACDRDGLIDGVLGTQVQWRITGGAYIPNIDATQISNYNPITQHIALTDGFVSPAINVPTGVALNDDRTRAVSYLRTPTTWEKQLFNKKWPLLYTDPTGLSDINFAVAAIDIYSGVATADVTVETILTGPDFGYAGQVNGNVFYETNVDFAVAYPMDDPIMAGDANADGVVDAADITMVERIIMGLDEPNINADTNQNGFIDMGDVVKISRIILGLE